MKLKRMIIGEDDNTIIIKLFTEEGFDSKPTVSFNLHIKDALVIGSAITEAANEILNKEEK